VNLASKRSLGAADAHWFGKKGFGKKGFGKKGETTKATVAPKKRWHGSQHLELICCPIKLLP
jgi:hypothetical protein